MAESLYQRRIKEGLCGSCGKEPTGSGGSLGAKCKELSRQRAAAKRDKQRSAGLCIDAGCTELPVAGGRCAKHNEYQKQKRQESADRKHTAGTCVATGCHRPAKEGLRLCQECIDYRSEIGSKHYREQRDAGLCGWIGCDQPPDRDGGAYCAVHREADRQRKVGYKLAALDAYGGRRCVGCGYDDDIDILEIDHIAGGGNKHRKSLNMEGGGSNFYRWLKNNSYPKGYRVLCPTCNKKAHRGKL